MLKVGDVLKAQYYCFPDHTTPGKEYVVTKVEEVLEGVCGVEMFWIIDDLGQECMPISTLFQRVKK